LMDRTVPTDLPCGPKYLQAHQTFIQSGIAPSLDAGTVLQSIGGIVAVSFFLSFVVVFVLFFGCFVRRKVAVELVVVVVAAIPPFSRLAMHCKEGRCRRSTQRSAWRILMASGCFRRNLKHQ